MNTNPLDIKNIGSKITPALEFLKRYAHFFFFLFLAAFIGYLVWHINSLTSASPTEDEVSSKLKTTQRPRIDQKVLDQIQQLEDQNIEVKSLFQQARNNPFSED